MPEDISTTLNKAFGEFTRGLNEFNAQMTASFAQSFKMMNEMAPHNLMAQMAGPGAGTFSAKMTTQELRQRNIFGEG